MSKLEIVLASTSRHRRSLLERVGLTEIEAVAPRCDEVVDEPDVTPVDFVRRLSRRKAESVAKTHPQALIIGSDQVVEIDGEILGKPVSAERAIAQLQRLSGREHRLVTGLCVHQPSTGRSEVEVDIHRMKMWPHTREQLARYVALDQPLDCAGAYRVEAVGATLFESMAGEDYTAIIGLPICLLAALLRRFDVTLLECAG